MRSNFVSRGSQIHDISARIRLCVPDLDARVTDDDILTCVLRAPGGYVQTVGVPCDGVLFGPGCCCPPCRMPSFFGYMAWSGVILLPLFGLVTWLFFL